MSLQEYRKKRDFAKTPEPAWEVTVVPDFLLSALRTAHAEFIENDQSYLHCCVTVIVWILI